tara:strand:+ start:286 stop:435 length:150 start_codon:yes stop_codon:yes gene_type:complete
VATRRRRRMRTRMTMEMSLRPQQKEVAQTADAEVLRRSEEKTLKISAAL